MPNEPVKETQVQVQMRLLAQNVDSIKALVDSLCTRLACVLRIEPMGVMTTPTGVLESPKVELADKLHINNSSLCDIVETLQCTINQLEL